MSKVKTGYDEQEIDEIINLYIKEHGGVLREVQYNAVSKFNVKIANNEDYRRENGELFKLYKYNFWGGAYQGQYNFGKRKIIEFNEKNKIHVVGKEYDAHIGSIVAMIHELHKKPHKLTKLLVDLFEDKLITIEKLKKDNLALKQEVENLKSNNKYLNDSYTALFCHSQSPNNSLNNMMNMSKKADSVCYDILLNMFGNLDRFEQFKIKEENTNDNIVSMEDLARLKRLKELEDEGF